MELYNIDIFRDNSSYTMILILDTIIDILNSTFSYEIGEIEDINLILKNIFEEIINEALTEEEPMFHRLEEDNNKGHTKRKILMELISILINEVQKIYDTDLNKLIKEIKINIKKKAYNLSQ